MSRKYDLIIYGASGFTGVYVVEEIVNVLKSGDFKVKHFSWAVAGRSQKKISDTLQQVSALTGVDLKNVDIVIADTSDISALRKMTAQCSIVLNVVGPYRFYGENVVKACLAEATSHIDLAGELQFVEKVQVLHDSEARDKNIYIVGTCGFDSIPADCGVSYLEKNFDGEINSIECHVALDMIDPKLSSKINIGTWSSAVNFLGNLGENKQWQERLYTKPLPDPKYKASKRWPLHFSNEVNGWCMPFPGTDEEIVKRSRYRLFTEENKRPIQYHAYIKFPYLLACFGMMLIGLIALIFAQFKYGLYLLEKYAHIFSFGLVSHNGPTRDQAENALFSFHLVASGWSKKLKNPQDEHAEPPNKKMELVVSGVNPGYRATAAMLLQSAISILQEKDKMPSTGGVYTPGVAFADTTLVERLQSRGIKFRLSKCVD
ncbi:unnamed protein product [Allacma fusca]|uniref:Saccharopine dehydrogenase NADP binding domain-containing protein n=1 Tax=Allacma fusca TaxID=39272 RepID=A0A8J2PZZ3_9HEXA|nr:unnamed protein product [Allacma fusca]